MIGEGSELPLNKARSGVKQHPDSDDADKCSNENPYQVKTTSVVIPEAVVNDRPKNPSYLVIANPQERMRRHPPAPINVGQKKIPDQAQSQQTRHDSPPSSKKVIHRTSPEHPCRESKTTIQGGSAMDKKSDSDLDLQKYLERSGFDLFADSFLQEEDFTQPYEREDEDATSHQVREYTLRQWIASSKPKIDSNAHTPSLVQTSKEVSKYIKSALLIALKLTECILEAEKDECSGHRNPIPLASITPEHVLIRSKRKGIIGESDETELEEIIEFAWVMTFVGDDSATGTIMSRLFAVGRVLYELLSTEELTQQEDISVSHSNLLSMTSINLGNEDESDQRSLKKPHRRTGQHSYDNISDLVANLQSCGVPWSPCSLVKNLLECKNDSFCHDDAYTNFNDLHVDLQLMIDNPSCYLDNVHLSNKITKLAISDKLYGRDRELSKLKEMYQRRITGEKISGTIISGAAGVGKSKLAMYIQKLTNQSDGYFLSAKFEQNQMGLTPLSIIANMFDSLCEMLFNDCSHSQLTTIEEELMSAIGDQSNLLWVMPSLRKLMPSCVTSETSAINTVDSAVSTRYLFGELLRVISSHSKPITLFLDDVQFADHASLLLVANLLYIAQQTSVFFALSHRDDETGMNGPFNTWLISISIFSLETIKLESISPEGVNDLLSETLHLSPRITRPLSSVLHHKTRGNPLFLRQLLNSLTEQGYIYVDLREHKWAWDLDKIVELKISDSVLALLMKEIQRLPDDLKFGLQVASCFGSCVTESMLDYLSKELGLDLVDILHQVSQKGFMIDVAGSTMFYFVHDKIQEAAYELMPDQQRRANHMRFGLALCTHTLNNGVENEELFFAAVNQINQGGPAAVHEPNQKNILADLNLKAGRRSIDLSDYNTAFKLFQHGVSFLGEDRWASSYRLSIDLYDSLTEVALILNKLAAVELYVQEAVAHARCFDDKLNCKVFFVS